MWPDYTFLLSRNESWPLNAEFLLKYVIWSPMVLMHYFAVQNFFGLQRTRQKFGVTDLWNELSGTLWYFPKLRIWKFSTTSKYAFDFKSMEPWNKPTFSVFTCVMPKAYFVIVLKRKIRGIAHVKTSGHDGCMPLLLRHTVWKTGAIVVGILYCTSGEARRLAHNAVLCCREPLRNNAARTNTNVHALG